MLASVKLIVNHLHCGTYEQGSRSVKMPELEGLNDCDLRAIEAVSQAAGDRFSRTIMVLTKEVRRLQEMNTHLRGQLHEALGLSEIRNQKRKMR